MTVYVDDMRMQATVPNGARSVSGRWSHLMADTEPELIEFAVGKLGMRASWIQHPGSPDVHFDVVDSRRLRAITLGAVPIKCRSVEWMDLFERQRAKFVRRCANCSGPLQFIDTTVGSIHWYYDSTCPNPEPGFDGTRREWMPRPYSTSRDS
jgi:hypothetical protein